MKKNYFIILSALIFCVAFSTHLGLAFAQENAPLSNVNFPIQELGNCANKQECKAYCDIDANMRICLDFAEKQGLFSERKIEKDRKIFEIMETMKGPGGCANKTECDIYCSQPEHMEECIIFGKKHGLIPPEELKEAEQVLKAIKKGLKPLPCGGKQECDIYCSQPEHIEECVAFGEAAGFISPEEAEMIRKTGGKGPGGCQGKEECDAFCQNPDNMQECMEFGLKYGFMSPEEEKNTRMTLNAIKKGFKPPACRSKEECDIYCSQPEHMEECIAFGEAAGFISNEEANRAKNMDKMDMGPGPGGCQGDQECKEFCDNPENMKECLEFAIRAGLISEEEAERIKKMDEMDMGPGPGGCQTREQCDTYCQNPDNMQECMEFGKKMGLVEHQEFERMERMSLEIQHNGPGGCQTPQECKTYCDNPENMEECIKFSEKMGLMKPAEAGVIRMLGPEGPGGPGGCIGREECKKYCMEPEHTEECINFFLEEKIMIPEDANRMREMRQMAPPMQMMPDSMMPNDMIEHHDDMMQYPDAMMSDDEKHQIMMPDNMISHDMMPMMPFDMENMPIEKLMEFMPPEMIEKLKNLPPEEIEKVIRTFKLETMPLIEQNISIEHKMQMDYPPMEYDEKMRQIQIQTQMQTQMYPQILQQDNMPMIMPDNMMPSSDGMMSGENKMPMMMPDNMMPYPNDMILHDDNMMQYPPSPDNTMPSPDNTYQEPMYQEPKSEPQLEPEPQTFFDNTKQFLANLINIIK
jgi:hypothetical protein